MNAEIDISSTVLRTERLVLRSWRQSDLEDFFAYASVDGVGQMAGWKPHTDREESRAVLDLFIREKRVLALEYRGKVIGSLGIEEYDEAKFPEFRDKRCREIGYALSKDYWGRGLMPEAVKEAVRYLFEDVGLDVILCGYFLFNKQSERVQEKCGFRHYAFGKYETQLGTVEEDATNILTKEDWLAGQQKAKVRFYDQVEDRKLRFAVIVSRADGHWVFCRHKDRSTLEIPGGHREPGENILATAKRELYEETGAVDFSIEPVCVYSVTAPWNYNGEEVFGMLYLADIRTFEKELRSEIEQVYIRDKMPEAWTYPDIQPLLLREVVRRTGEGPA